MAKLRLTKRKKDLLFLLYKVGSNVNDNYKEFMSKYHKTKNKYYKIMAEKSLSMKFTITINSKFLNIKSKHLKGSYYRTLELLNKQGYVKIIKNKKKGDRYKNIKITKKGMNIISSY